ncbi:MAG: hypothetical protein JNN07_15410, partial [Verrucomicrobiales bacterium]|nr:hypothetical protein [Verrucomicrobiales bacterium]
MICGVITKNARRNTSRAGLSNPACSPLLTRCRRLRRPEDRIGRWLSRDPIGDKGGLNYYSFVENGPNTKIDPDGRDIFVDPGPIDPLNP